ncbi:hypothetical protein AAFF_G00274610 [Aldrovandia affinis]|uniref:Uncharacterized protein n=1 Tax=Aldrovandia affinis TaxID=143900 RepID=A0AAD7SRR2_9TELE|nr:hypothetical protein AAFF_G00274610 [Aldrovandia affinis]
MKTRVRSFPSAAIKQPFYVTHSPPSERSASSVNVTPPEGALRNTGALPAFQALLLHHRLAFKFARAALSTVTAQTESGLPTPSIPRGSGHERAPKPVWEDPENQANGRWRRKKHNRAFDREQPVGLHF